MYVYSFAIYNESGVEFDTESDVISFFFSICLIFISSRDLIPYFFYDDGNINSARASLNILTSMAATTVSIFNWIGWILRMHFFVLFLCFFLFFNIFFSFCYAPHRRCIELLLWNYSKRSLQIDFCFMSEILCRMCNQHFIDHNNVFFSLWFSFMTLHLLIIFYISNLLNFGSEIYRFCMDCWQKCVCVRAH